MSKTKIERRGFAPHKKPETIRAMWDHYFGCVYPMVVPDNQRKQLEQAFYAGSYSLLAALAALGDQDVAEIDAARQLERWKTECEAASRRRIQEMGVDE